MLTDQEERAKKRRTLLNDARVREQSKNGDTGTFLSHTHIDDAGGRFAAVNAASIVGQDPQIKYPQLPSSSPWSGAQPEPGIEPPTGYRIDEMTPLEPSAVYSPVEVGAPVSAAPSSAVQAPPLADDVETSAGAPLSLRRRRADGGAT